MNEMNEMNEFTYNTKERYTVTTKKYSTVYLITVTKKTSVKVIVSDKTVKRPRVKPVTWAFCMSIDEFERKMAKNSDMSWVLKVIVSDKTVKRPRVKPVTFTFCMLIDEFERKMAKNSDISWVLKVDRLQYRLISQKYYDQYESGKWDADSYELEDTLTEVLERGDEHLIIQGNAWGDGFIRDVTGTIIMRNIIFDYINSGIKSGMGTNEYDYHYDIQKAKEHLDKHRQVIDVKVIDIPYYNEDFPDQKGIEFIFVPKNDKEFQILAKMGSSWDRNIRIKEILGVEQFRVKQE